MPAVKSPEQDSRSVDGPAAQSETYGGSTPPPEGTGSSSAGSWARKLGLVVILLAAGGFTYWKIESNKKQEADTNNRAAQAMNRAIPVTVAPVVAKTMPIYLTALGTVTAYNTVTVKSRVDGQLLTVNVREGQQVKQGQVLAQIDPRPYEAALAQAQGQLAKDQATADYAKAEAGRYTALYEAGVVSKDSQQVQQSSAGQSQGVLEADRAAIQAARVNVTYTRITSPITGVVGLRQVDAGNIVHASDATGLLVVTQLQPIAVIFTLPEDQLPQVQGMLRAGRTLTVEAYDRSDTSRLATGKLLTLDNEIDTTTGTVKGKAVFDNHDGALFPNQFVNVRLILEERQNALVMPVAALQNGANGTFVYVVRPGNPPADAGGPGGPGGGGAGRGAGRRSGGRAPGAGSGAGAPAGGSAGEGEAAGPPKKPYYVDVQNIAVDLTEGSQIILRGGLNAGDQVVVDGQEKLRKYSKVDPTPGRGSGGGRGGRGATGGGGSPAADAGPSTGPGTSAPAVGSAAPAGAGGRHGAAPAGPPADGIQAPNGTHGGGHHRPAGAGAPRPGE